MVIIVDKRNLPARDRTYDVVVSNEPPKPLRYRVGCE